MAQIDDLKAAFAALSDDTAKTLGDLAADIVTLTAAVAAAQAANPAVDLTDVIASVNALDATVKAADPVPAA